jgi:RNA polymerase sigma-70 factor, ECF subfamily
VTDPLRQAFDRALEHWRSVYGFARQFVADAASAEDLAQEAYLKLWARASELDLERPLLPLLLVTVRNLARSRMRADRAEAQDELDIAGVDAGASPAQLAGAAEERGILRAALATLPPHWRGALFLVDGIDLGYRDAASALGMTEDVLRVTLHRARQRLRERVGRTVPGAGS